MLKHILPLALLAYSSIVSSYRLPSNIKPTHYVLDLTVESLTSTNNSFTGLATINLLVTSPTNSIQFHANPTYINISRISLNSTIIESSRYHINHTTEILTITYNDNFTAGEYYVLSIAYEGTLNTNAMSGFYKSSYPTANGTEYLVTTDFEASDARKAFPCWDEPIFKASFDISLTYPMEYIAIANTKSVDNTTHSSRNLTKVTFAQTPIMPTYLIAFTISKFTPTEGDVLENNSTLPQKVWSRESEAAARIFASNLTSKYVDVFNNYTNFTYSRSISKLDQVAIPDFAAGAMENWGLITYRETALLYYEDDTSNSYKDYIARVVSHELAHQWFGNLVTLDWWSHIFLNEGFATFFEYYVSNQVLPEFELKKQFSIKVLQYAMLDDASTTTKAISANATTPTEISAKFSTINYEKAGSVLKMLEQFLGEETFKTGLQTYLRTYAYQNVEPENLWTSFNTNNSNLPAANLSAVMDSWINNAGFPLVTASWNSALNQLQISQERFLYSGVDANSKWYIPISYTFSNNLTAFEDTSPVNWLTPTSNITLNFTNAPNAFSWVILNNQQTSYYRVNYCPTLWRSLINALQSSNFSGIIEENRAQIVDDAFNLARASKLNYTTVFNIVNFLQNDTSYFTWYPAFNGFNFILQRVGISSAVGQKIAEHILSLSELLRSTVHINSVNSSEHIYSLKQQLTNSWALKLGHNATVTAAQRIFDAYKISGKVPDKNLRNIVYCNAMRHSKNVSDDWKFLWSLFENTSLAIEKMNIISGLGSTSNVTILKSYLEKTLTNNSGIRPQDYGSVMSSVYSGSPAGVDVALDFLIANFSAIQSRYTNVHNIIKGIANYFTSESQVAKLRTFANSTTLDSAVLATLNSAIASATSSLDWVGLHKSELHSFYGLEDENSSNGDDTTGDTTGGTTNSTTARPNAGMAVSSPEVMSLVIISVIILIFKL